MNTIFGQFNVVRSYGALMFGVLCQSVLADRSQAHEMNTSYTKVHVEEGSLRLVVSLDEDDLKTAFDMDADGDGRLLYREMKAGADQLFGYLQDRVAVRLDGELLPLNREEPKPSLDGEGNLFLEAGFSGVPEKAPDVIEIELRVWESLADDHRNLLELNVPGQDPIVAAFSSAKHSQRFVLVEPSVWQQVSEFTWWGVEHIFIGYDHIMFLLALIVVGGRLGVLVKIISAFTIAHSITLILSALEVVTLPDRLIESGIALSIAYVAAENFWLREGGHRWVLTFLFGLIHGFGFANVLRDLGLPSKGLVASLLAFNVGVEIGQIVIVLIANIILWLILLFVCDQIKGRRRAVQIVSAFVLLFGLGWFVERVFDLSYMPL